MSFNTELNPVGGVAHDPPPAPPHLLELKKISLRSSKGTESVLSDIDAVFTRGRTTAVLGLSGCGKTVLLQYLAGRLDEASFGVTGEMVGPDGTTPVDRDALQRRVSYVPAIDVVNGFDTPREAIVFRHRLAFGSTAEEAGQVAERLLEDLGLAVCADNLIAPGVGLRGISGGQRRRTAIAMALATAPELLVLDEPTTGLDSATAKSVMGTIQKAARTYGCVVVQSLQQPGSDLFAHFDDVVLLNADGSLEYSGPTHGSPSWVPKRSVAEDVTEPFGTRKELPPTSPKANGTDGPDPHGAGYGLMFLILFVRQAKSNLRNPLVLTLRALQAIVLGVFFGMLYFDLDLHPDEFKLVLGFTIVIAVSSFIPAQTGAAVFPIEQPLFVEEAKLAFRYPAAMYGVTKLLSELAISAPLAVLHAAIIGGMVGLSGSTLGNFCLSVLLLNSCSESVGFLVSTMLPAAISLSLGTPMVAFTTMIFGTSIANPKGSDTEEVFNVVRHVAFLRPGYTAVALDVFDAVEGNCTSQCVFPTGQAAKEFYDMEDATIGEQWGQLAAWFVGFRLLSFVSLTWLAYNLKEKYSAEKHRRAAAPPSTEETTAVEVTKKPALFYDPTPESMTVAWDATFTVKRRFGDDPPRTILHGLRGTAAMGRTLAIMGGSGAGKSTLLEAMSMRLPGGGSLAVIERDVDVDLVSGGGSKKVRAVGAEVRSVIAFVHQDNHFVTGLSVREVLEFAASTSARGGSEDGWREVVVSVEEALGLQHVSGLPTSSLSVSQRKRLAVGAALCQRRPIVMLDEPTSGLDPASALNLLRLLQELAHEHGITVLYTLHQPGDELLPHIDDLLLLSDGHVVYHGPLNEADDAFAEYPRAAGTNATDHYLELCAEPERKAALVEAWRQREMAGTSTPLNASRRQSEAPPATETEAAMAWHAGLGRALPGFRALVRRSFTSTVLRQPKASLAGRFAVLYLLLPVLIGVAFWNSGGNALQVQGAAFSFAMGMSYCGSMGPLLDFHLERLPFLREQEAAQYPAWAYYAARTLAALPMDTVGMLVASIISYFMAGFSNDAGSFFEFFAAALVTQHAAIGVIDALGVVLDSLVVSVALATLFHVFFVSGAGVVVSPSRIDETGWLHIVEFLSPTRQAMLIMLRGEMEEYPNGIATVENVLEFNRRHDENDVTWPMLVGLMIVYRGIAALVFTVTTRAGGYRKRTM